MKSCFYGDDESIVKNLVNEDSEVNEAYEAGAELKIAPSVGVLLIHNIC